MAVITVDILVTELPTVMLEFDRIKVYRSTTGISGTYTELTTPTTRISLIVGQQAYQYTDIAGDETYYYRLSYYNSTTLLESSLSTPQQGEDTSALGVLTVEELKAVYLPGINLTNDQGVDFSDILYTFCIRAAVARMEREIDTPLRPTRYVEELHDYIREDYRSYVWIKTDHAPVISVEEIKMVLPVKQTVQIYPTDWINIQIESGGINIIPGAGMNMTIFLGSLGLFGPAYFGGGKFLPNVFHVTYTAGFLSGQVPYDIKELIGMMAAIAPLLSAGELILGAGISSNSLSIDGLSQGLSSMASAGGGAYQSRVKLYQELIKDQLPKLRDYYRGIRLQVV